MKKQSRSKQPLTDVLKASIAGSELTLHRLAIETGLARDSLVRFMAGETSLRLDKADKLADYFKLELVPKAATKKTK